MTDDIKVLEDLVVDAVDRLRSLTRERDELRERIDTLNERVETAERDSARAEDGSEAERAWRARQAQSLTVLREALAELRGDERTA